MKLANCFQNLIMLAIVMRLPKMQMSSYLMTEWNQYRALDFDKIKSLMTQAVFVDLRNVYSPEKMKQHGFNYVCVGR